MDARIIITIFKVCSIYAHYPKLIICLMFAFMNIILASQSPRRLFLLQAAGFEVQVCASNIDETAKPYESVQAMTLRLCEEKAKACDMAKQSDIPIVAADTLVSVDEEALGQPQNLTEAKLMIQKLSGKQHQVYTAVCVRIGEIYKTAVVTTTVCFRELTEQEIEIYLQNNDILDKAGAYAIQGGASSFIVAIQGCLDNVIGLPILQKKELIEEAKLVMYQKAGGKA